MTLPAGDPEARWLADLVRLLAADPGVVAVRLLGSSARGEAVGAWVDGGWQRFSDIELLVVTARRLPWPRQAALRRRVRALADTWGQRSPLFHVDLLLRPRSRLADLPPFLFTYELREAGRTLYGPELREEIRPVDLAGLDRRNTREILFKRLWHLAEALPADWLRGRPLDDIQARGLAVNLARQPLDLPTALLPESGVLQAGYAAREAAWLAAAPPFATTLADWLGSEPASFLAACRERRSACEPSRDPFAEYRSAVAFLAGGLAWLVDREDPAGPSAALARPSTEDLGGEDRLTDQLDHLAARLPAWSRHLFNEGAVTPGERLAAWRQGVRLAYSRGPAAARAWWRAPRKGHLAAGLLRLHAAGLAVLAGRAAETGGILAAARKDLAQAHGDWAPEAAPALPADPIEAWLAVRREAARAFWRVARLGAKGAWRDLEAHLA